MENKKDIIYLKNESNENIEIGSSAEYINDYFINIGPKLAKNHKGNWNYFDKEEINNINKLAIDKGKIHALIADIDISKSSGIDDISSRCLKDV